MLNKLLGFFHWVFMATSKEDISLDLERLRKYMAAKQKG
jgi:hypothetical protein